MHQIAPRAIRRGVYFAQRSQHNQADDRSLILGALAGGPVAITPAHRQDFSDRVTFEIAMGAV